VPQPPAVVDTAADEAAQAAAARAAARLPRLEAAQERLLRELDAQAAEIERLFDDYTALQARAEESSAAAAAAAAHNARLRDIIRQQSEERTPVRPTASAAEAGEAAALRAERDALQAALGAASRREAEAEAELGAARAELARAQAATLSAGVAPVLAGIESRLLQLRMTRAGGSGATVAV
jgi:chromosome segregation ATPase